MPVVSFVGERFRACWRFSCYFIWYSMDAFPSATLPTCSGEVRVRTNASVCYYTAVGLVGGWMGECVCRAVRGWCFVGKVEADVVLVRLLCSARKIGISTPCRAV